MVVFAVHRHELATGVHVPHPGHPARLPPHPTPLGCPRAPAVSAPVNPILEGESADSAESWPSDNTTLLRAGMAGGVLGKRKSTPEVCDDRL